MFFLIPQPATVEQEKEKKKKKKENGSGESEWTGMEADVEGWEWGQLGKLGLPSGKAV